MTDTPPAIGSMRLEDSAVPALPAARYRVTSALEVERRAPNNAVSALAPPPAAVTHVEIAGPRFSLEGADITERHPPPGAKGGFGDRLPHLALGRRTLPWERSAPGGGPWLALLLFAADEAQLSTGAMSALLPAAVVAAIKAVDPVEGDPSITVVKAKDLDTFRGVMPSQNDMRLLAHTRRVNLADTALAGRDDDGVFAIVAANRLPLGVAGSEAPYLACLVSLEGRDDAWATTGTDAPSLIVLHSWTFTTAGQGGTFESLARTLDVAPFGSPAAGQPAVIAADGTVALQRTDRQGQTSEVCYRGPLLGLAAGQGLPEAADDISAISAFELGRMLGMADGQFLRELAAWRRANETQARDQIVASSLMAVAQPTALARTILAAEAPVTTLSIRTALAGRLAATAIGAIHARRIHPAGRITPPGEPATPLPDPPQ